MAAGKMNPTETVAVAPVNWSASQMLGTKLAPRKMKPIRAAVTEKNLRLSKAIGMAYGKKRPSTLRRREKNTIGKTSIRWTQ
ncbi:hypothetical protein Acr_04g0007170 [Actinidia rufa]|uniref:Uncharacterized protein n=1 Tax=Actinidia rufa TaxID=165716 RepID=A0A7J0EJ76_9ERIC|nr:hypothetical protein Acr_04g0007170 [Actinidia rufa]